jgi:predicted nuclease of restriction endonuclease-like RecB superfamily
MIPLQLLRVKITKKGKNIVPVFCTSNDNDNDNNFVGLQVAAKIIEEFEESYERKEKRALLEERVFSLESHSDYKLVRGFFTLLERRCIFSTKTSSQSTRKITNTKDTSTSNRNINSSTNIIDPISIRKYLFEESSKRGLALTDFERKEIISTVASKMKLGVENIVEDMWSDLEENMVIEQFDSINPDQLVAQYNLSLMQTMLFNCTKLEFHIEGGANWKRVLKEVKRLGLMYNLEYQQDTIQKRPQTGNNQKEYQQDVNNQVNNICSSSFSSDNDTKRMAIICSIEGPLSIIKLTDRYGTAIAKLLPSIISCKVWFLRASIVRKTISSGKKMYDFEMSNAEAPPLPKEDHSNIKYNKKYMSTISTASSPNKYFDSSIEEKFANRFEQSANGWRLIREPDPLIVSNGKALIPDFMFEKYNTRIYFEIVGFWTKQYLERKIQKIKDIMINYNTTNNNDINFFIAVNADYCTASNDFYKNEKLSKKHLSSFIDKNHLILYENNRIPIKPILDHLKYIDIEMTKKFATDNNIQLLKEIDQIIATDNNIKNNVIISLGQIAEKYNIPIESVLSIIKSKEENEGANTKYLLTDAFLILKSKITELESSLRGITKFSDACSLFKNNTIPESCYVELITKLGYNILWRGIDYNNATIERKEHKK